MSWILILHASSKHFLPRVFLDILATRARKLGTNLHCMIFVKGEHDLLTRGRTLKINYIFYLGGDYLVKGEFLQEKKAEFRKGE